MTINYERQPESFLLKGMDNNDKIMTLEEVAEYLRVKPQTIYTWAQENKIPAAKIGREWRFRKTVIDKWFDDQMNEKFRNY
jgi:excisionase family DNA binding protein